jgi:hypothetical protein
VRVQRQLRNNTSTCCPPLALTLTLTLCWCSSMPWLLCSNPHAVASLCRQP